MHQTHRYGLREHHTTVAGLRVTWVERAADPGAQAPDLLMIPGLGMTWRSFKWFLDEQPRDRRILIVHPPGARGSDPLPDSMNAEAQAAHLDAWAARIGLRQFDLLGHSFGAFTAARLAARSPQVLSLRMVAPSPDGRWSRLPQHLLAFAVGAASENRRTAPQAVLDYLRANPRVLRGFTADIGTSAQDLMDGVTVPVLVVRGTDDHVSSAGWGRALAEAVPHGRVANVRDAAHGLPQDDPEALTRAVRPVAVPVPPSSAEGD